MNEEELTGLVTRFQANESDTTFARVYEAFEGLLVTLADIRTGHREDLIQDGAIGLLEAVRTFDPERGVPLKAYARKRIRWAISKGARTISRHHDNTVNTDTDVHGSTSADALERAHARRVYAGLTDIKRQVLDGLARGQAGQDIASAVGISPGRVTQIKDELRKELRG